MIIRARNIFSYCHEKIVTIFVSFLFFPHILGNALLESYISPFNYLCMCACSSFFCQYKCVYIHIYNTYNHFFCHLSILMWTYELLSHWMYYLTITLRLSKFSSNLEHKFLSLTLLLFHNYYQVLFVSWKLLHSQFQALRKIIPSSRKISRNGNQIYKSRSAFIFIGISLDLRELISLWIHEHMDMSYMYLTHTECYLQHYLYSGVSFSLLHLSFTLLFYNKNPQFQCTYSLVHSDNTHKTSSEELDIHSYDAIPWKKRISVFILQFSFS